MTVLLLWPLQTQVFLPSLPFPGQGGLWSWAPLCAPDRNPIRTHAATDTCRSLICDCKTKNSFGLQKCFQERDKVIHLFTSAFSGIT